MLHTTRCSAAVLQCQATRFIVNIVLHAVALPAAAAGCSARVSEGE